jgi:hypothetical protein
MVELLQARQTVVGAVVEYWVQPGIIVTTTQTVPSLR